MTRQTLRLRWVGRAAILVWAGVWVAWLGGCASMAPDLVSTGAVRVERVDSDEARLGRVYVREDDGTLHVSGRLEKRDAGRSPIRGRPSIEVLGDDGRVLAQRVSAYYRLSPKMELSTYSREFAVRPADVRTVRVVHDPDA